MQSGRLAPVAAAGSAVTAAAAAASAGMVTPPPAAAVADEEGMMDRMRRFMQQIPGTSPMGTPMATPSGGCRVLRPHRVVCPAAVQREAVLALPSFVPLSYCKRHSDHTPPPAPLPAGRPEGPSTEPLSEMDRRQRELYAKQQQLLREQRTTDQEKLLAAIGSNLGFHAGCPVAAITIFRCCLQWRTFQADRTPLFDRIIAAMGSQVGRDMSAGGHGRVEVCGRACRWLVKQQQQLLVILLNLIAPCSLPLCPNSRPASLGGAVPGGQRHAGLLAVQHRHTAVPDAKECEARQQRRLRGAHLRLQPAGAGSWGPQDREQCFACWLLLACCTLQS